MIIWCAAVLTFLYLPLACSNWILLGLRRWTSLADTPERKVGRRVLAVLATDGGAPEIVERIFATLRSYELGIELFVLKEEKDTFAYSSQLLIVPLSFRTPNRSLRKLRALQFGIEELTRRGFGAETYLVHLDDDSIPSKEYFEHVLRMDELAGQGNLRLREHGRHLLSTLADMGRVSDCDAYCTFHNRRGKPNAVHGEGLVLRADVEAAIGWDFGTFGGEDWLMGQLLRAHGIPFGYIPHAIAIAPPVTSRDFFRQRRRWFWATLSVASRVRKLSWSAYFWFFYRYIVGWAGLLGGAVLVAGLIVRPDLPPWLLGFAIANMASYFAFFQYGVAKTARRYAWRMIALQIPVAFYESFTLVYALLFPPDRLGFDVIRKV